MKFPLAWRRKWRQVRVRRLFIEDLETRRLLASGPRVLSSTPTEVRNANFDHVDIAFSANIDAATVSAADLTLDGPAGVVAISSVAPLSPTSFRFQFAPLTIRGDYRAVLGPDIRDTAGELMNQDNDSTNGEAAEDQFRASLRLILADVIFTTNTTISETNTQFDGKSILIDGTTVSIDGPHQFISSIL